MILPTLQPDMRNAFLAHNARRLADLLVAQGTEMLQANGLRTPSSAVSTVLHLRDVEATTVTDLAKVFGHTHQMAAQRIAGLVERGLVERICNRNDRRSSLVSLTSAGRKEALQLANVVVRASAALDGLLREIGCDLTEAILTAERHLQRRPLLARMEELAKIDADQTNGRVQ